MKTFLFLCALLLASPALADANGAWSGNCQFTGGSLTGTVGTPVNTSTIINKGMVGCYRFNSTASTHNSTANGGLITVGADSAVITFDPELNGVTSAASAALVIPHYCASSSVLTAASPELSCIKIGGANGNAALDGVEGAASTQNAAIRVGPGIYYFEVSGACVAGETCQVSVKGESSGN